MKLFCSVFVVFMVILAVASAIYDKKSEIMDEKITKACINEHYTGEDWKKVLDNEPLTKCTIACIMKKVGIINEVNKFVPEKLYHYILDGPEGFISKDGKNINEIRQTIGEVCEAVSDPDECDSALMIYSCVNVEAEKHGLH